MLRKLFYICLWISILAGPAHAKALNVACAANFTGAMKELAGMYAKTTGEQVQCTFGSTGMLYGQIKNGASYDLFFAADERRPSLLFNEGLAFKPSTYAKGTVVLWTKDKTLAAHADWKTVITSPDVTAIGMASPKTAPYGQRTKEAMIAARLFTRTEPKLAFGKSVSSAFQYAYSGAATVAFVALSQALSDKGKEGTYWIVNEAQAVTQAACIIKAGNERGAREFLKWMNTGIAQNVIHQYGYE